MGGLKRNLNISPPSYLHSRGYSSAKELATASTNELSTQFSADSSLLGNRQMFLEKMSMPSLSKNLLLYSSTLSNYYSSWKSTFYGFDSSEKVLFRIITENLVKEFLHNGGEIAPPFFAGKEQAESTSIFLLYETLHSFFIPNLIWKKEKCAILGESKTAGIYILFYKE